MHFYSLHKISFQRLVLLCYAKKEQQCRFKYLVFEGLLVLREEISLIQTNNFSKLTLSRCLTSSLITLLVKFRRACFIKNNRHSYFNQVWFSSCRLAIIHLYQVDFIQDLFRETVKNLAMSCNVLVYRWFYSCKVSGYASCIYHIQLEIKDF